MRKIMLQSYFISFTVIKILLLLYILFSFQNFSKGAEIIFLYSKLMQQGAFNTSVIFLYVKSVLKIFLYFFKLYFQYLYDTIIWKMHTKLSKIDSSIISSSANRALFFHSKVKVVYFPNDLAISLKNLQKSKQANAQEVGRPKVLSRALSNLESALGTLCPPPS